MQTKWEVFTDCYPSISFMQNIATFCIAIYIVLQYTLLHFCFPVASLCFTLIFVHSVPDILLYFISAGGGLRMAVEECSQRVESKTRRG